MTKEAAVTDTVKVVADGAVLLGAAAAHMVKHCHSAETAMTTGRVKWFDTKKGYGFLASDAGGSDVFVHISDLKNAGIPDLYDDQRVSFDVKADSRGRNTATNLAVL